MRARLLTSIVGVVAALALVIGLNLLADRYLGVVRADLTQGRLYTLSSGTRQVLANLKDPITLRLYYSRKLGSVLPVYGAYADRVREMLREYAAAGGDKIKLEFYDPEPFSDIEDRALALGLQGVPVDQGGERVYFGISGSNPLDDERQISFLKPDRERFLEYDLTKLVYGLSNPSRPVVAVLSSLPLDGDPRAMMMRVPGAGRPWVSMLQLRQTNTVRMLKPDVQAIDKDVQVLMLAGAANLPDAALYAIDQFVMRGGRLMAMVDPYSEATAAQAGPDGQSRAASFTLPKLFDAWGIRFDPSQVVADPVGAWRVRAGPGDRAQAVDYLAWFNARSGLSRSDPATADLQQVTVASAGALSLRDGSDLQWQPLLSSSAQSGTIPAEQVKDPDPAKILAGFKPQGGARVIAARVRGSLHSAYGGPPALPEGIQRAADLPAHLVQTSATANLVVVADTDLLADRFWVRVQDFFGQQEATPFSDNGAFVANLVGTLAGGDALIGLRSRGESIRPFERVDQMQRDAEARFRKTEQQLQTRLEDTQKRLTELRQGRSGAQQAVITPEQRQAIDTLRQEIVGTRRELRTVQLDLRRDISALETKLKLFNIVLIPVLLTIVAVAMGVWRNRRRARARA